MSFVRNWLVPILLSCVFALLGFMVLGLPGVNMIQTLDGNPVPHGIAPDQVTGIITRGGKIGGYFDFYGIPLPGEPLYWAVGVPLVAAIIGYRLGARFRTSG